MINSKENNIRPIAIYLPQFHPIPENNEWWGKGFTEWTNVAKAKPLFNGHYQPHLPADLGFYDLRLEETRLAQEELAKKSGIYGFCYYHYWFNGKRLLETPLKRKLENPKEDFPFMLCWANENWTRVWDGREKNVLLEQQYSEKDDVEHIRTLIKCFKDSRYIRVDGKPVMIIYKSCRIPDIKLTIKTWRNEASKEGIELYLCRMDGFGNYGNEHLKDGFDAAIDFEPFSIKREEFLNHLKWKNINNKTSLWYLKYKLSSDTARKEMINKLFSAIDYSEYVDFVMKYPEYDYKCFPGITPMWDNTARKKENYFLFRNSNPEKYQQWLQHEVNKFEPFSKNENFIFINAWNEWAEGNHLEPCQKWGKKYLEATGNVLLK